jgi:hypothetical protein
MRFEDLMLNEYYSYPMNHAFICFYRSNSKKEEISCLRSSFWFYPMTLDSCNVIFFNHDYKIVNVGSSVRSTCVIEMS